jgi:RNA polymerase sigma-70 factor (ECF subfamily)
VEDIAQQVFTKVYFSIPQFDFRSAFLTWLYKITVNECYDHLRKQRANRMVFVSEMSEDEQRQFSNRPADEILPDRQAELAQTTALLLRKVPEEERLLLLLREVEGYSIHDLARMFSWNENTVKVKLFRARQRLVKIAKRHSLSKRERRDHAASR